MAKHSVYIAHLVAFGIVAELPVMSSDDQTRRLVVKYGVVRRGGHISAQGSESFEDMLESIVTDLGLRGLMTSGLAGRLVAISI